MPLVSSVVNGFKEASLDIEDRAVHYGDGLFETMLCLNGKIALWDKHVARLMTDCKRLSLNHVAENTLLDDLALLIKDLSKDILLIKIIVTRGPAGRGLTLNQSIESTRILLAYDYAPVLDEPSKQLKICKTKLLINETLGGIKHLNRLIYVLAAQELNEDDDEGLLMNDQQELIECITHNVFFVKEGCLMTAPITDCGVAGIMRQVVLDQARAMNIEVKIKALAVTELNKMDECFITNAVVGVQSVSQIDEMKFNDFSMSQLLKNTLTVNTNG